MNHPKDTAPIAAFRNVETTVKTLAADTSLGVSELVFVRRRNWESAVP